MDSPSQRRPLSACARSLNTSRIRSAMTVSSFLHEAGWTWFRSQGQCQYTGFAVREDAVGWRETALRSRHWQSRQRSLRCLDDRKVTRIEGCRPRDAEPLSQCDDTRIAKLSTGHFLGAPAEVMFTFEHAYRAKPTTWRFSVWWHLRQLPKRRQRSGYPFVGNRPEEAASFFTRGARIRGFASRRCPHPSCNHTQFRRTRTTQCCCGHT